MKKELSILYASGVGDIIKDYQYWKRGVDSPTHIGRTNSSQFFDVCKELNASAYILSLCPKQKASFADGNFIFINRPPPLRLGKRRNKFTAAILYHTRQIYTGIILCYYAVKYRVNVILCTEGNTHLFMLFFMWLFRIDIIPSFHTVLWLKYKGRNRLLWRLNELFLSRCVDYALSLEGDCYIQLKSVAGNTNIQKFIPIYKEKYFSRITSICKDKKQLRVLFVGRIEISKGILILLEIAKKIKEETRNIVIDVCGRGSLSDELIKEVKGRNIDNILIYHDRCERDKLLKILGYAHVLIAPTTTSFVEGYNRTIVEAVLANIPVITSPVCPAMEFVKDAVAEVKPDDMMDYYTKIIELHDNRELYEEKRKACLKYQEKYYDEKNGYGAKLKSILLELN